LTAAHRAGQQEGTEELPRLLDPIHRDMLSGEPQEGTAMMRKFRIQAD
jgi:hypothetical protein